MQIRKLKKYFFIKNYIGQYGYILATEHTEATEDCFKASRYIGTMKKANKTLF